MKASIKKSHVSAAKVTLVTRQEAAPTLSQAMNLRATTVGPVLEGILSIGRNLSAIGVVQAVAYKRA